MYQALYRKYRPKTFDEVFGQKHITTVLQNQVKTGRLPHAYLFCGSRGTGKTSCAKLLAKAVNCAAPDNGNPCNECESCRSIQNATALDVIELDAASNNGVNEIRALCEEVLYSPAQLKKRVYIIDEVHMLTPQAFNALLKTLEEPPEHIVFILATTEIHKVLPTVVSRCQRMDFQRIDIGTITERIMGICAEEQIEIEREAAWLIAKMSDGGMRDALSILESCTTGRGEITVQLVTDLLGLTNREFLYEMIRSVILQNGARAVSLIGELYGQNGNIDAVFSQCCDVLRDLMIVKTIPSPQSFLEASKEELEQLAELSRLVSVEQLLYFLSELSAFINQADALGVGKKTSAEITVLRLCHPSASSSMEAIQARLAVLEQALKTGGAAAEAAMPEKEEKKKPAEKPRAEVEAASLKKTPRGLSAFEETERFIRLFSEQEPMMKFFVANAKIFRNDDRLVIRCDRIAKDLLGAEKTKSGALAVARSIDPQIREIVIECGAEESGKSDLDRLI